MFVDVRGAEARPLQTVRERTALTDISHATLARLKVPFQRFSAGLAETSPPRSHRTSSARQSEALAAALLAPSFLCTLRPETASSPSPITDTCSSACRDSPSGRPSRRSDVTAPLELDTAPVFRPTGFFGGALLARRSWCW